MNDETGEIPQHHNQLRRWAAEHSADRVEYEAFRSLAEARKRPDAAAILDTSWDSTLAVFPVSRIVADEATLDLLLADLEAVVHELDDEVSKTSAAPSHGRVFYETMAAVRATHWDVGDHLWLDDELFAVDLAKAVEDVLRGVSPRIDAGTLDRIPLMREWWPAVERGDVDAVRDLLDRGVRPDAGDRARFTALARSTRDGDLAMMQLLLDRGADPNAPGWQTRTPTTAAASRAADCAGEHAPDPRPLEMLLAAGGRLGMREAVILGDVDLARKLLDEDPSIDLSGDARYISDMTFLKVAAMHGHPDMARYLLDAGADLEACEPEFDFGWTALSVAALEGRADVVALLLDRGAAIDYEDLTGRTPLALAAEHGRDEVVRLLLDRGAALDHEVLPGCTPLALAAEHGRAEVVRLLIDRGARRGLLDSIVLGDAAAVAGFLDSHEHAPEQELELLDLAVRTANLDILRMVLESLPRRRRGLEPSPLAGSLLFEAVSSGRLEVVKLLIDHGSDPFQPRYDGLLPVDLAEREGHACIAEFLHARRVEADERLRWDY
ncbi:ankyrin repeat domain-containing protein [Paludisphaera soli]|uniref:ankyrin repeat domain-containing protein n=1 Tax=Paludisphaera soli TaxID=2712865 RepID=UPI0013ED367E|nr:ankyrin repeat domain-containing protein [Paludisphaera soli]